MKPTDLWELKKQIVDGDIRAFVNYELKAGEQND